MNSLTIPDLNEELHQKLAARARANHRSIEAEAVCCLREAVEMDEEALNSISPEKWSEIERSVYETIHDQGTPLTDADFERCGRIARAGNR